MCAHGATNEEATSQVVHSQPTRDTEVGARGTRRSSRQLRVESMVHELVVSQAWLDVRTLCTVAAASRRMLWLSTKPSSLGRSIDLRDARGNPGAPMPLVVPVSALESLLAKDRVYAKLTWLCLDHTAVSVAQFRVIFRHIHHIEHFLVAGIEHSDVLALPKKHCKFIHVQNKNEKVRVTYARLHDLLRTDEAWLAAMLESVCEHHDGVLPSRHQVLPHPKVLKTLSRAVHSILTGETNSRSPDTAAANNSPARAPVDLSNERALVPFFKNTCLDFQTHTPISVRSLKWAGSPLWVNIKVGTVSLHLYSVVAV